MVEKTDFDERSQNRAMKSESLVQAAGYSVAGTRHTANQDRFLCDPQHGLFLVADGMGGTRAGERAAQLVLELLPPRLALLGCERVEHDDVVAAISQAILDVNEQILFEANLDARCYGMGTTVVLALRIEQRLFIASLGDSRAYLVRAGNIHQYTIDHNMAQTLVRMGVISREAAEDHQWSNLLWKYLGSGDLGDGPDIATVDIEPGDRFVLTSDGVTSVISSRDMANLSKARDATASAAEGLVRAAIARGSRDDATAVVIDFPEA